MAFTIDAFTTETLQITLKAGSSLVGSLPVSSRTTLYITADSFNDDWILKDNAAALVGGSASLGGVPFSAANAEDQILQGDSVRIAFGNFATGSSLDTDLTLTMGQLFSGGFDPTAVDTLVLSWGLDGQTNGTQPWGIFQSSQSVSAVPEPGTAALVIGLLGGAVGLSLRRRRPRA